MSFVTHKTVRKIVQPYYSRRGDVRTVQTNVQADGTVVVSFYQIPTHRNFFRGKLIPLAQTSLSPSGIIMCSHINLSNEAAHSLWLALEKTLFPE